VVNGNPYNGQPQCYVHAFRAVHLSCLLVPVEAYNLKRYVPLVVIHCHATVVLAAFSLGKECVGRHRSVYLEATFAQFVDGRYYLFLFFPAEQTVVACMRIKSGNAYAWVLHAELLAGIRYQFGYFYYAVFLYTVASLAQRYVCRHVDYAQELIGKKHGILLCSRIVCIYLGVPVKVVSAFVQRFFVERSSHGAVHLVRHCQLYGFDNRHEGCVSALWSNLTRLECVHVNAFEVDYIYRSKFKLCFTYVLNRIDFLCCPHLPDSPFHYLGISCHYRAALLVSLFKVKSFHNNLRTDAGGVAHSYCQYWLYCFFHSGNFVNTSFRIWLLRQPLSLLSGCFSAVAARSLLPLPCRLQPSRVCPAL